MKKLQDLSVRDIKSMSEADLQKFLGDIKLDKKSSELQPSKESKVSDNQNINRDDKENKQQNEAEKLTNNEKRNTNRDHENPEVRSSARNLNRSSMDYYIKNGGVGGRLGSNSGSRKRKIKSPIKENKTKDIKVSDKIYK